MQNIVVNFGARVATEFEHRSFGEELTLCQRYFQLGGGIGRSESPSTMSCQCFFHPTMRAAPTITVENTSLRCGQLGIALVNIICLKNKMLPSG